MTRSSKYFNVATKSVRYDDTLSTRKSADVSSNCVFWLLFVCFRRVAIMDDGNMRHKCRRRRFYSFVLRTTDYHIWTIKTKKVLICVVCRYCARRDEINYISLRSLINKLFIHYVHMSQFKFLKMIVGENNNLQLM